MKITVMTADEKFVTLDLDPQESVENVKALLEVETQVSLQQQQLLYNGKEIKNSERLSAIGIVEGDLIMMVPISSGMVQNNLAQNPDGSAVNPRALQQHIRGDANLMNLLLERDPGFADAILGDNLDAFQNALREQHQKRLFLDQQKQEELALLTSDPFDVEAQKRIEEAIRQKSVDENWETALEYNPEAFAKVVMLYVDMEVNGHPIKAFVDSGAQVTIISKQCAERCGLLRLLDKRFGGVAHGVGQTEIVGRIHAAPIKIGNQFYICSFTVLDSPSMEFLFGLDMLRKHQCQVDLKDNVLRVGGGEVCVPFLQEKDIPAEFVHGERLPSQGPSFLQDSSTSSKNPGQSTSHTMASGVGSSDQKNQQGKSDDAKIRRLMELGFDRPSVIQALTICNGNEEQAAAFLFGG